MPTRYFVRRLISDDGTEEPPYVFPDPLPGPPRVELYDLGAHACPPRLLEPCYRWAGIFDGEVGVDEIPARES